MYSVCVCGTHLTLPLQLIACNVVVPVRHAYVPHTCSYPLSAYSALWEVCVVYTYNTLVHTLQTWAETKTFTAAVNRMSSVTIHCESVFPRVNYPVSWKWVSKYPCILPVLLNPDLTLHFRCSKLNNYLRNISKVENFPSILHTLSLLHSNRFKGYKLGAISVYNKGLRK